MTANVKTFENMFQGASSFNQDISGWSTGKATSFAFMFHKASSFNFDLSDWATSSLTTVESMFSLATSFNRALCWRLDTLFLDFIGRVIGAVLGKHMAPSKDQ